jgi:hypothetical protein
MSTFQNRYQNHSNRKLVEIIDSPPGHYQGEALKAARAVLAERQVSEAEIQAIRSEIADEVRTKAQKAAEQAQKREAIANQVHQTLEPVDMVRRQPRSTRTLVIMLGVLYGLVLLTEIRQLLSVSMFGVSLADLFSYINVCLLLSGMYLFFKGRPPGWVILAALLVYYFLSALKILFDEIAMPEIDPALEGIFVRTPIPVLLVTLLFYVGWAWAMLSTNIKTAYQVKAKQVFFAGLIGMAFSLLVWAML